MGTIAGTPLSFVGTTTTAPVFLGTLTTTTYTPQGVAGWRPGYPTFAPPARESRRYTPPSAAWGDVVYWLPGASVGGTDPAPTLIAITIAQRISTEPTPDTSGFDWLGARYETAEVRVLNPFVVGSAPTYSRTLIRAGPWNVPYFVPLVGAPPAWASDVPVSLLCLADPLVGDKMVQMCSDFFPVGSPRLTEYDASGQSHRKQSVGFRSAWRWDCEEHRLLYSFVAAAGSTGEVGICPVGQIAQDVQCWLYRIQVAAAAAPLWRWTWTDRFPDGTTAVTIDDVPAALVTTSGGYSWWRYVASRSTGTPAAGAYVRELTVAIAPAQPAQYGVLRPRAVLAKKRWSWPYFAGGDCLPGLTYSPGATHAF